MVRMPIIVFILAMIVLSLASIGVNNDKLQAYAANNITSNNQQLDDALKVIAKTNKIVYGYGEPILLNITLYNSGSQPINISSSDLKPYAGLSHSCSNKSYIDFLMINGSYSANEIQTYDDLFQLKSKAIYVYDPPFNLHSCLIYLREPKSVQIAPDNGNVTITFFEGRTSNFTGTSTYPHSFQYDIRHESKEGMRSGSSIPYVKSVEPLPIGKYTIVAFAMSGQISKPIEIEVTAIPDRSFIVVIGVAAIAGIGIMVLLPKRD